MPFGCLWHCCYRIAFELNLKNVFCKFYYYLFCWALTWNPLIVDKLYEHPLQKQPVWFCSTFLADQATGVHLQQLAYPVVLWAPGHLLLLHCLAFTNKRQEIENIIILYERAKNYKFINPCQRIKFNELIPAISVS